METFETVTDAITKLKEKGYSHDFNIDFNKLTCKQTESCLNIEDFEIMAMYRFEGETNPGDEDIVYAVESKDGKLKGILTSAYGLYADAVSTEMLQKLTMHKNP